MKILVIDIGNTNTSLGVYKSGRISKVLGINTNQVHDQSLIEKLKLLNADNVAVASVVPEVNLIWKKKLSSAGYKKPLWINHLCNLGVGIDYPKPNEIGADRLANAAAAVKWVGLPAIICDFGTALTFDVIDKKNGYIGGVICPGVPLMLEYLAEKTSMLPIIKPIHCGENIGRSTNKAMQIGAKNGYQGMIYEVIKGIKKDLKVKRVNICVTGGYSSRILEYNRMNMKYFKYLTLMGIGYIWELNQSHK